MRYDLTGKDKEFVKMVRDNMFIKQLSFVTAFNMASSAYKKKYPKEGGRNAS